MVSMKKQLGLSLIELMIAITLGIVLMTGVVQVFLSSKVVFSTQQGISRIQETGRLAIEFISRDARMAAYYGCHRPDAANPDKKLYGAVVADGLHGNFDVGVIGYNSVNSVLPLVPDGIAALAGEVVVPEPVDAEATGDANILVIRGATETGFPVSAENDVNSVFALSPSDKVGTCVEGLCEGDVAVVSDCSKARVFQVSTLAKDGNTVTVAHADPWGGDATKAWEIFAAGDVAPMNTIVYFLAKGAGVGDPPSLWQKTNDEDPVELLEGVEKMRITYAAKASEAVPEPVYEPADLVADWSLVNAIRIELVVRSIDNNVLEEGQPYTFNGAVVVPPEGDRYMRQVFSTTIGIRSRSTSF